MTTEQKQKEKNVTQTVKKFAALGVATVLSLYTAQAASVFAFNNLTEARQDAKMVSLYNNIWLNIHKSDMDKEIKEYKNLADNMPEKLKVTLFSKNDTVEKMSMPRGLPSSEDVEQKARELSDKTRLKIRRL